MNLALNSTQFIYFRFTELNHKPADLSERIIFKSKSKTKPIAGEAGDETTKASVAEEKPGQSDSKTEKSDKKSKKLSIETASKLSFAFDDDDEDEEDD